MLKFGEIGKFKPGVRNTWPEGVWVDLPSGGARLKLRPRTKETIRGWLRFCDKKFSKTDLDVGHERATVEYYIEEFSGCNDMDKKPLPDTVESRLRIMNDTEIAMWVWNECDRLGAAQFEADKEETGE